MNILESKILLGSVARKYLHFLLTSQIGPEPGLLQNQRRRKNRNPSELFGTFKRNSTNNLNAMNNNVFLNDRNLHGNTLLSISPLHDDYISSKLVIQICQTTYFKFRIKSISSTFNASIYGANGN